MRFLVILALVLGSAGTAAAYERATGLPRRTIVVSSSIEIFEPIRFRDRTATIVPESTRMLDAVAGALVGNPDLTQIEIRVHAATTRLATRRARAVVAELVARGVAPDRLRAVPVQDPRSAETELFIVERASEASSSAAPAR